MPQLRPGLNAVACQPLATRAVFNAYAEPRFHNSIVY